MTTSATKAGVDLDEQPELWAPGSAVLALGEDASSRKALAIWHVSPQGQPTGAWVSPYDNAFSDRDTARRLLLAVERRAITATDPDSISDILGPITAAAGCAATAWWQSQVFSTVEAFGDITTRREEFEATVASAQGSGRTAAPLQWARELAAEEMVTDFVQLQDRAAYRVTAEAPVVSEALAVSRILGWLIGLWAETEQVKARRRYVRDKHGGPEPLPPRWLTAVKSASTRQLPL